MINWIEARLEKVVENPSTRGDSTNYFFEFLCLRTNSYITTMFNSKMLDLRSTERIRYLNMIISLLHGNSEIRNLRNLDTNKLLGKTCWIKVEEIFLDELNKYTTVITNFSVAREN